MVSNKHAYATDSTVGRAAGGRREDFTRGPGPFGGLGRAVVRHPWLTILAWVVVAVGGDRDVAGLPPARPGPPPMRAAPSGGSRRRTTRCCICPA